VWEREVEEAVECRSKCWVWEGSDMRCGSALFTAVMVTESFLRLKDFAFFDNLLPKLFSSGSEVSSVALWWLRLDRERDLIFL
jgi:hypothetical protein